MASITKIQLIKFIELILVIVCVFLHYNSFVASSTTNVFLQSATYGGYLIIMIGAFSGAFMEMGIAGRIGSFFALLGGILYILCGIIAYNQFSDNLVKTEVSKYGMTKAWASIITGIVFIVDLVYSHIV